MKIVRLYCLCLETYKTINSLITDIFKLSNSKKSKQNALNLNVTRPNQVKYGDRSLRVLSPKIWNNLSSHIKSTARKVSKCGVFSGP